MKNILIISAVFPPEPLVSANLSFDLAHALSEKQAVTVICPAPTRPMGYDFSSASSQHYPFRHIMLHSYTHPKSAFIGRFRESYSFGKACAKFISAHRNEIDIIYMNTWPLFGQYFAIKEAKKYGILTVLHIQDIYPEAFTQKLPPVLKQLACKVLSPFERYITNNSTKIVTISKGMKDLLVKTRNISNQKVDVVYNWQDEAKFLVENKDEPENNSKSSTHFMFLGSFGPVANVDNLIRAFSIAKGNNLKLTLAGEGSEKKNLQQLARDLKETRINFIHAPASEAGNIQAKATILLLSLKKGAAGLALPSKLPAYMFSAKPIIATVDHDSDTANAIRESGCGWVLEPGNPVILAELMQEVAAMPKDKLKKMGLKGREYALKYFTKKSNLLELVKIIEAKIMSNLG